MYNHWRHRKRGTEYILVGFGKMQAEGWYDGKQPPHTIDMRDVAIYRSVDDGSLWVRPKEEFEDGRFEELVLSPNAVHMYFGLSYASYYVMPRLGLSALPADWQQRFVDLMREASEVHGMECPDYFVVRDDPEYILCKRDDPEDDSSRINEYWVLKDDPWADYRRGDAKALSEEEKSK